MTVLFTHRYFWPDSPPYAAMLREITRDAVDAGHDVQVFCGRPSYRTADTKAAPLNEVVDGIKVRRARVILNEKRSIVLRVANVFIYCAALFVHILRTRPDVVTASTFPPVIAAWTASLGAKLVGAKFTYHMQDVHPEVSKISGGRLGRGVVFKLLVWLDSQTMRRASAIVVLSEDKANTVRERGLGDLPIHIINNFSLGSANSIPEDPPKELVKANGTRRILFAGNLGRFQNLPALTTGIAQLLGDHSDVELMFLGDGEVLPALKQTWGDHPQIKFAPFLPFAQAEPLIRDADVGLVSLAPDVYRVSFPSKVLTYAGLGVPMLALVEPNSALAREIVESDIGEVPASSEPDDIAAALDRLLARPDRSDALSTYTENTAAPAAAFAKWRTLFDSLTARQS